jgi:uncharacterized membrane protein HdeD (DUF308 family)
MDSPTPTILPYATPHAPAVKLFSLMGIVLGTFFGAPMGGALLLALNYRRMEKSKLFWPTLICGALATAALVTAGFFLPPRFPGTAINIVLLFIVHAIAKHLQGGEILMHQSRGGAIASNWLAVGIGLLTLTGVFIVVCAVLLPLFLLGYIE